MLGFTLKFPADMISCRRYLGVFPIGTVFFAQACRQGLLQIDLDVVRKGPLYIWPWVKIQIVHPVRIPNPTKVGSKMGGAPTLVPLVLTTTAVEALVHAEPEQPSRRLG